MTTLEADAPARPCQWPEPGPAHTPLAADLPPDAWPATPGLQPFDIIDRDDRQPVPEVTRPPWKMVCHLVIQNTRGQLRAGTGWLAGPSTVFTAGHNLLYPRDGHQAVRVWVVPGRSGSQGVHGQYETVAFDVHPQWRAGGRGEVDVGVVWLPQAMPSSFGWFGFSAQPERVLQGLAVRTSGYPEDRLPFGSQWFADSTVHHVGAQMLAYGLDTVAGQSGSPVFAHDGDGRAVAVAVHVYGAGRENLGVRITPPIFQLLSGWWR
jgi:V8-like Glu-specific endopeptidase